MTDTSIPVIRARLRYETIEAFIEGYTRFIRPGRMFIPMDRGQLKPEGTQLRFEFLLEDGTRAFLGQGIVRQIREPDGNQGPSGVVVEYTHLSPESKAIVQSVIEDQYTSSSATNDRRADESRVERDQTPTPSEHHERSTSGSSPSAGVADHDTTNMASEVADEALRGEESEPERSATRLGDEATQNAESEMPVADEDELFDDAEEPSLEAEGSEPLDSEMTDSEEASVDFFEETEDSPPADESSEPLDPGEVRADASQPPVSPSTSPSKRDASKEVEGDDGTDLEEQQEPSPESSESSARETSFDQDHEPTPEAQDASIHDVSDPTAEEAPGREAETEDHPDDETGELDLSDSPAEPSTEEPSPEVDQPESDDSPEVSASSEQDDVSSDETDEDEKEAQPKQIGETEAGLQIMAFEEDSGEAEEDFPDLGLEDDDGSEFDDMFDGVFQGPDETDGASEDESELDAMFASSSESDSFSEEPSSSSEDIEASSTEEPQQEIAETGEMDASIASSVSADEAPPAASSMSDVDDSSDASEPSREDSRDPSSPQGSEEGKSSNAFGETEEDVDLDAPDVSEETAHWGDEPDNIGMELGAEDDSSDEETLSEELDEALGDISSASAVEADEPTSGDRDPSEPSREPPPEVSSDEDKPDVSYTPPDGADELDNVIDSLDDLDDQKKRRLEDVSLELGGFDDEEGPSSSRAENDSTSLDALAQESLKQSRAQQNDSEDDEESDLLDDVLGDQVHSPPSEEVELDVGMPKPNLEPSSNAASDDDQASSGDEASAADSESSSSPQDASGLEEDRETLQPSKLQSSDEPDSSDSSQTNSSPSSSSDETSSETGQDEDSREKDDDGSFFSNFFGG